MQNIGSEQITIGTTIPDDERLEKRTDRQILSVLTEKEANKGLSLHSKGHKRTWQMAMMRLRVLG